MVKAGGELEGIEPQGSEWEGSKLRESELQRKAVSIEEKLQRLPETPGVYMLKDSRQRIIYVGKARSLRQRVRSYFHSPQGLSPRIQSLVAQVADIDFIATDTEVEALILECNLIKHYHPRFNVQLRDDKTYPYLKLTLGEEFPRLLITRQVNPGEGRYFGPYTDVGALRETLRFLARIFPLRSCKSAKLPVRSRACLNAHIGQCLAPCQGEVSAEEYAELVKQVVLFLEGQTEHLREELRTRMEGAAEALQFERAARLRDQLRALEAVIEKQKVVLGRREDLDVIGLARSGREAVAQVFFVREGKLVGRESFRLLHHEEGEGELLAAFLKQYYAAASFLPPVVLLPAALPPEEEKIILDWLRGKKGKPVRLAVPRRGEKRELVAMAVKNASFALEEEVREEEMSAEGDASRDSARSGKEALRQLQDDLGLNRYPRRIEGFDISHLQGRAGIGSQVVFIEGEPCRSQYRRFSLRTVSGPDDYAALEEVLRRRFVRGREEQQLLKEGKLEKEKARFAEFPDLILIDGGRGQVQAAARVLEEMGLEIPCIGLAKEQEHLYWPGAAEPLVLPRRAASLKLLQRVRDEAHRFAVEAHRRQRGRAAVHSLLEEIPGIGPARRRALLQHFGSLERMRQASVEELAQVKGMSRAAAQAVAEFLRAGQAGNKVNKDADI